MILQNHIMNSESELKFKLITRDLQEINGSDQLIDIINKRPLKIYFGTAPTKQLDISYLLQLMKIGDFLEADCEVTILIADLHAYLDCKLDLDIIGYRTVYYENMIRTLLVAIGINVDKLKFVYGTDFQLGKKYTMDVYKLMSILSYNKAHDVVMDASKQKNNLIMGDLLYPGLQILDEEYLDVDCQYGNIDQKSIMLMAEEYLPKLGYKKRIHLMTPIISNINEININLLDSSNKIIDKINNCYCKLGNLSLNPPMDMMKFIIFPLMRYRSSQKIYIKSNTFKNYEQLESSYNHCYVHPDDLKLFLCDFINNFLEPVRNVFNTDSMQKIIKLCKFL